MDSVSYTLIGWWKLTLYQPYMFSEIVISVKRQANEVLSDIFYLIVLLKIWWNENYKYDGMKIRNKKEWKLEIWWNRKLKYDGMRIKNMKE